MAEVKLVSNFGLRSNTNFPAFIRLCQAFGKHTVIQLIKANSELRKRLQFFADKRSFKFICLKKISNYSYGLHRFL
mgnify:FL=1